MSTNEIIEGIKQLSFHERLVVIEKAIKSLRSNSGSELEKAAKALMADYKNDKDLTAFTALDYEKFYEAK